MATESLEAVSVTPQPLMQMMQGMHVTAILQAGVQLGIFDHIADGSTDAATIAMRAGADERGTRILLDALTALRLLDKDGGYRLSPLADAFLVSSRPSYFGAMTDILDSDLFWQAFSRFGEASATAGRSLISMRRSRGTSSGRHSPDPARASRCPPRTPLPTGYSGGPRTGRA